MQSHPFAIVIAAPSGAGKTSLAQALVEQNPQLEFSISATTRKPRPGERDGYDYYFVDDAEFDRMAARGELLEWAVVHGRRYGTPRHSLDEPLARGKIVMLDIDVQGARQVRAARKDAVLIFVLPPSMEELYRRLRGRGSEDPEARRTRLATAQGELGAAADFDYLVVNDDFERALETLRAIVIAEQHRLERVTDLPARLDSMQTELTDLLQGQN